MINDKLKNNNEEIVNTIKLLLYKENQSLLEKVDFDDDNVFLEPLLFAYFNSKKDNLFSNDLLKEIMQGYFVKKEPLYLKESFDKKGTAYIPNLGYYDKNGLKVDEILKIDAFEVLKTLHPLLDRYFTEVSKGHIINAKPMHNSVWQENYKELENAIELIKVHLPNFYDDLIFSNKRIYLHDNPKILNFTSIETLGMLFFYIIGKKNIIYFIEELIHQGSHNFLYFVVHNRKDYFKIDVDNIIMRDLTKAEWDYRNVYGAFHGLFTVTQRVENFDILLSKNVFTGSEKHELLARMADQFGRFRTGLELLNLNGVYTDLGKQYYNELDTKCSNILTKYGRLKEYFDTSNPEPEFRYEHFCNLNPIEDYYKKEAEGFFNF